LAKSMIAAHVPKLQFKENMFSSIRLNEHFRSCRGDTHIGTLADNLTGMVMSFDFGLTEYTEQISTGAQIQ
jgi:hypothetical protein